MTLILPIGDCHIDDEQSLERFNVASSFIVDKKPDYIIIMGDFLTLNCLSAWDKDKRKKMEGRRYSKEIAAGNDALDRLHSEIIKYNKQKRKNKEKQYKPTLIFLEGNHSERLRRYLDYDPTFDGHVSIEKDLRLKERGYQFIPYREYYYVNKIGFTHIPFNKSGPISGVDITRKAQMVTISSVVFGHTHEQHLSHIHKEGMPHLQDTYNCGCFFDKKEDYVQGCVTNYWRGLTLLNNWKEGRFDVDSYSLGRLERMYGVK
jgi:UDP-2,3-diacylglucosamine pyrophosphatase LpxH